MINISSSYLDNDLQFALSLLEKFLSCLFRHMAGPAHRVGPEVLVPMSAFPDFLESPLSLCFQDSQGWLGILATQERILGYSIPVPSCRLTDFKMPRRVLKNRNLIQPKLGLCAVVGRHRVGPSLCTLALFSLSHHIYTYDSNAKCQVLR